MKQIIRKFIPKPIFKKISSLRYRLRLAVTRIPNKKTYIDHVVGKRGIEVGGPSMLFKTLLPVYQKVANLDGVNFSSNTVWEENIKSGLTFNYIDNKMGHQFISDATDLSQIKNDAYDFLLSSNCLEHVANPIKALMEWKRVIKTNGAMILVLPNKDSNFDHNRPITSFDHILQDFLNQTTEKDLTHLDEILAHHDLSMDPPAGDIENFRKRSLNNYNNRALHHHVFDLTVIEQMLKYAGFEVIQTAKTKMDFFALALKN